MNTTATKQSVTVERVGVGAVGTASNMSDVQKLVTQVRKLGKAHIRGTEEALRAVRARHLDGVGWIWEGTKRYVPCTIEVTK
jgi:hypothetical protein